MPFVPGYIRSPSDPRDYLLKSHRPYKALPLHYEVPGVKSIPVLDQGSRGSCVAFACSFIKVWQELQEYGKVFDLSEEYLYTRCKQLDGFPLEEGTFPRLAMAVLRYFGTCDEKLCPYQPPGVTIPLTEEMDEEAQQNRIASYARVVTLGDLKAALMAYGPVLIGVPIYENWFEPLIQKTGLIPSPRGENLGGHALAVYGWNRTHLLIRNSWGKGFGLKGDCLLPFDYPDLLADAWLSADLTCGTRVLRGTAWTPSS